LASRAKIKTLSGAKFYLKLLTRDSVGHALPLIADIIVRIRSEWELGLFGTGPNKGPSDRLYVPLNKHQAKTSETLFAPLFLMPRLPFVGAIKASQPATSVKMK